MADHITRREALDRAARAIGDAEGKVVTRSDTASASNLLRCAEMWLMLAEEIRATFEIEKH